MQLEVDSRTELTSSLFVAAHTLNTIFVAAEAEEEKNNFSQVEQKNFNFNKFVQQNGEKYSIRNCLCVPHKWIEFVEIRRLR